MSCADDVRRQIDRLIALDYPALAGVAEDALRARLEPLARAADAVTRDDGSPRLPAVLVAGPGLLPPSLAMGAARAGAHAGVVDMRPTVPEEYATVAGAEPPAPDAWLLLDVDTGAGLLGVTPDEALPRIVAAGRSPLTIAEGVAVITQHDGILRRANAFSLLGSRRGDRRVPALWTTGAGTPRLGWCWAGAPHDWLGSASCGGRLSG